MHIPVPILYTSVYIDIYIFCKSWLCREKTQSIGVLRIVEFAEMTKPNVKLLRIVLCDILTQKDEQDVLQIFQVKMHDY
jgi:hypothetical protein